jgi:hypothetical protein
MTRIEEVVFEAMELGIRDSLYNRVGVLSYKPEYRYVELHILYEEALNLEKEMLFKNNLVNESRNT